jgi:hypothetical protein
LPADGIAVPDFDRAKEVVNALNEVSIAYFCDSVPPEWRERVHDELRRRIDNHPDVDLSKIEVACQASEYVNSLASDVVPRKWNNFNTFCEFVSSPYFDPLEIGEGAMDFYNFVRSEIKAAQSGFRR